MIHTLFFFELSVFLMAVLFHLIKKSTTFVQAFLVQSIGVSAILFLSGWHEHSLALMATACLTILVKVIIAPVFFNRLITRHEFAPSGDAYLSTPFTLLAIAVLTMIAYSPWLLPLTTLNPASASSVQIAAAALLISLLLIINHKDALAQIIGILSFENAAIAFASRIGEEHTFGLELGITFDAVVWIMIAGVFVSMLHRHFGSLDVSKITSLKE